MTAIHSPLTCDHCSASGVVLRECPTVANPYTVLCSACWWQQADDAPFHSFPLAQEVTDANQRIRKNA